MKILLIGPKYNKRDSNRVGGIVVLFENLIDYFSINDIEYKLIDTNKAIYNLDYLLMHQSAASNWHHE